MSVHQLFVNAATPSMNKVEMGLGTCLNPNGHVLSIDHQCLYLDDEPWLPVMGEIHFSRIPTAEWRDALQKIKAGGVTVVSTYVFWIHHEEIQGVFDWSGQRSLSGFLDICRDLELMAFVRLGPWCHGEVRNGGFPDWVAQANYWPDAGPFHNRDLHPPFMSAVNRLYEEIAGQVVGRHLWKEGGPVIGIQVDNECWNLPFLHELKRIARSCGLDVPFTTMTGWNSVPIPDHGLIPLFGGYTDGFWMDDKLANRKVFQFSSIRDDGDMGAVNGKIANLRPERNDLIENFPYLCCEIGGGMPSSYHNRIHVTPDDTAALALVKLGCGNNMPGYYMVHGGINPEGKHSFLNETRQSGYPNDLPVKNYDFEAPIGAYGQIREHWFMLRKQHTFLQSYGDRLALMSASFPEVQPTTIDDVATLRWCIRSNGQSGFLFFNNHQRFTSMPPKSDVRFEVVLENSTLIFPAHPIEIGTGVYGCFPFGLDLGGIKLEYATAELLGSLTVGNQTWHFLGALPGIQPELCIEGNEPILVDPGRCFAWTEKSALGSQISIVVLSPDDAKAFSIHRVAGGDLAVLSSSFVGAVDGKKLSFELQGESNLSFALFPAPRTILLDGARAESHESGIFQVFHHLASKPGIVAINCTELKQGDASVDATNEAAWDNATEFHLELSPEFGDHLLTLDYTGDAARIYGDGHLLMDHFWNGQPMEMGLWRLSDSQLSNLVIKVLGWTTKTEIQMDGIDVRPDFNCQPMIKAKCLSVCRVEASLLP